MLENDEEMIYEDKLKRVKSIQPQDVKKTRRYDSGLRLLQNSIRNHTKLSRTTQNKYKGETCQAEWKNTSVCTAFGVTLLTSGAKSGQWKYVAQKRGIPSDHLGTQSQLSRLKFVSH